ncbi:hypothetical protein BSKO_10799 [Bryopsis sp. KO-2023]|nr:hypothetical protein BSKO_10799 [Bryopsis sp. KO-2023]
MPQTRRGRVALDGPPSLVESFRAAFPTIEHYLTSDEREVGVRPALAFLEAYALPPVVSGVDLPGSLVLLSTGCPDIDAALGGVLYGGRLVELTGESGSGKTQICHMVAANTAKNTPGGRVIYIDTSNTFSPARLTQVAAQADQRTVLSNVTVFRPHDMSDVLGFVDELGVEMSQTHPSNQRPVLIILDSVPAVVSPVLGGVGPHRIGYTLMVALGRALKSLALDFGVVVLTTNHEVRTSEQAKPALGEHWTNQTTVRVRLVKGRNNTIHATLTRASDRPVGVERTFTLPESLN